MQNPLSSAWSFLRGDDLKQADEKAYRFTPASPEADWQRINSLVYTANPFTADYAATGDGNSAVFACLMAMAMASIEPPLKVFRRQAGKQVELPKTPLQAFLDDPNPHLDMLEIRFWLAWARHCDGNAYLLKVRSGDARTGNPIELWPVSPQLIQPWTEKGSRQFIDYYKLQVSPGVFQEVPIENVMHFKLGIDDRDTRRGLSPLKRLVREIGSDAEATRFSDVLLKNFGIPGLVIELPPDTILSPAQAMDLKARIQNTYGADQRGGVGVLADGATMKQFGFSPEQLNLKSLHDVPETRIAAVIGVPPSVAGLGVGLEQTSNFASMKQVRENFTEVKLLPLWKLDEAKWNKHLKADFMSDQNVVIAHDLTEVRALQEDADALYTRLDAAVKTGWVLPDEARSEVGLPPMPDGTGMEKLAKPAPPPALPGAEDEEDPKQPSRNGTAKPSANGKKSTPFDDWPEDLQNIVDYAALGFSDDLQKHQNNQHRRIRRSLLGS